MKKKSSNLFSKIIATMLAVLLLGIAGVSAGCLISDNFRQKVENKLNINIIDKNDNETVSNSKLEEEIKNKESEIDALKDELLNNKNLTAVQIAILNSEILNLENEIERLNNDLDNYGYYKENQVTVTEEFNSNRDYTINLGRVNDVAEIVNAGTTNKETDRVTISKYGTNFNQQVLDVDFSLVNGETSRWFSHDGDKLYFWTGTEIIGYKDSENGLDIILKDELEYTDIFKISSFDNFVFVFRTSAPYLNAYVIEDGKLVDCVLDLTAFENYSNLANYTLADIIQTYNGEFMLGFVVPVNTTTAYTLYYTFDEETKTFAFDTYLKSENNNYTFMFAMHKNIYTDAQIIYMHAGASSSTCKRAIHDSNKKITTTYSATAYYYTMYTTDYFVKGRDIVVLKDYETSVWVYKYPQVYKQELEEYTGKKVVNTSFSSNSNYKVFKYEDETIKIFSNENYDTLTEIELPKDVKMLEVNNFEMLDDVLIFFMKDGTTRAYSIMEDCLLVENVTSKDDIYSVTLTRTLSLSELLAVKQELEQQVKLLEQEIDMLYEQIDTFQKQLDEVIQSNNDLQQENEDLQNQNSNLQDTTDYLVDEYYEIYNFMLMNYRNLEHYVDDNESKIMIVTRLGVNIVEMYLLDLDEENIDLTKRIRGQFGEIESIENGIKVNMITSEEAGASATNIYYEYYFDVGEWRLHYTNN